MSHKHLYIVFALLIFSSCVSKEYKAARGEREAIAEGNDNYHDKNYSDASDSYQEALRNNSQSLTARLNDALAETRSASALSDTLKAQGLEKAYNSFDSIAQGNPDSQVASMAYYNMGNLMFSEKKIDEAIDLYKKALRINPADSLARRNLRIAQLNQPPKEKNDNNKDNNNNQDQKDKDKDKQDQQQQQQQQKDQQQDQQQNPPQQQKDQQQPQQLNKGASDRILERSQNKEKEVRQRIYREANQREIVKRRRIKNW